MRKILLSLLAAALVLLFFPVEAVADEAYDITSYDVHITVSENNVIDVVERLKLNFTEQRHGFYYYLQDRGTAERMVDDEVLKTDYLHKVSDFNVQGYEFELSREDNGEHGYLVAKIGSPDKYVYGKQEYVISYRCDLGDNGTNAFDEFYRNLIMCSDSDTVNNASFIIELPKDFDESKVSFTLGLYGSNSSDGVVWERDGNTIKGRTTRPMQGGEILTARVQLPQNYFGNYYLRIAVIAILVLARLL